MKKKMTVHVISHSHWDREWYQSFEQHRMKLVELIDRILDLLENDKDYNSFFLDGQTIVLDDYLEIKPYNRTKIEKYVKEGRLWIGPWYILQDEFLTSGEACVRNLMTGLREAKQYGRASHIGYFPDAFGNAGQMPQVLKQAGMEAIAFGRGVKPVGLNNEVKGGQYESVFSEMNWQSPDKSALVGILFANWYHNGMEIPADEKEAKAYWDERLPRVQQFAGTSHLLFMNGCDHEPVQQDLSAALETARRLYPDIEFVHSNFEDYVKAVKEELGENTSTIEGELTSQETDGLWTLVNTCSANADLKKLNREGESALERRAEPAMALASLLGQEAKKDLLYYSWKKLMQNHPHDSICGCSVDEVNREIRARFEKSRQVADELCKDSLRYISDQIDEITDGQKKRFVVFNLSGYEKTQVIFALLDYERIPGAGPDSHKAAGEKVLPPLRLLDAQGKRIEAQIEDLGTHFGYELPQDRFRQPYTARRIKVSFEAQNIPPLGYAVYYLEEDNTEENAKIKDSLIPFEGVMENAALKVEIAADGSYTLTDKRTKELYQGLGIYEDTGDMGNEYIYVQDSEKQCITTKDTKAVLTREEDSPFRAVYRIEHEIQIPESIGDELKKQQQSCIGPYDRVAGRSKELVSMKIVSRLILDKNAAGLKVETFVENRAKDHRLRVLFPTKVCSDKHFADSSFEVVKRNNRHSAAWKNPSGCEHQQCFVAIDDEKRGILAANRGLYEYEILPDQDNTIAITLLRAVGEMGDWGYFPTPQAQMQGSYHMEYEIVPYNESEREKAILEGYRFSHDLIAVSCEKAAYGRTKESFLSKQNVARRQLSTELADLKPDSQGFFRWEGKHLALTAWKLTEEGNNIAVRFINCSDKETSLSIKKEKWFSSVYKSNVLEEKKDEISLSENGEYVLEVRPAEILTLLFHR